MRGGTVGDAGPSGGVATAGDGGVGRAGGRTLGSLGRRVWDFRRGAVGACLPTGGCGARLLDCAYWKLGPVRSVSGGGVATSTDALEGGCGRWSLLVCTVCGGLHGFRARPGYSSEVTDTCYVCLALPVHSACAPCACPGLCATEVAAATRRRTRRWSAPCARYLAMRT